MFLHDKLRVVDALHLAESTPNRLRTVLGRAVAAAHDLDDGQPERKRQLIHLLLHRVTLRAGSLRIELKRSGLWDLVAGTEPDNSAQADGLIDVTVPIEHKRRGVEAKLIMRATDRAAVAPDQYLVDIVARAHRWYRELTAGDVDSIREIAERDGIDASDVGGDIQLAFLAPDIVEAILAGRQPVELTARRLRNIGALPLDWERQRRLLGLPD